MEHGSPPSADLVYQGICQLFHNTNPKEKEKANKWLEEFQKSIYSWTIADELLQQKRDLHSCYFAAQTMRNKIQTSFDELPESSHGSLRDSLITHIGQITAETDPIIMTQLCLAIADLALLMANWEAPISDLLDILSPHSSPQAVWPLLEILTRLPEEVESRCLRLGNNRREELYAQLKVAAPQVLDFLCMCVQRAGDIDVSSASNSKSHENVMKQRLLNSTIRCFNSWVVIDSIPVSQLTESVLAQRVFQLLSHADAPDKLHDTASDCLCAILSCIEKHGGGDPPSADIQQLQPQIINAVCSLENVYHMSVAQEDIDKAMNYCRIFTTLCDAFFYDFFKNDKEELHYSVKCLDMVLMCVGHFDYEVAEITFALWYRLSESLFQIQNQELTDHFKPYIERLLGALYRHAQMDSDSTGLIEEQDSFYDFRRKVSDLIKDVAFIVGSGACFRQMFMLLQTPNNSWEATESALFIMQNVAKCVVPTENEVIPKVVEAILNMPENTHIAVRYTSIMLLGELCEWIEEHPESLEAVLNFLLYSLQQTNGVASAAAVALTSISATCRHKMIMHMSGFVEIARRLDTFEISNELAIGFLKSMSLMLSRLPRAQLESTMREVISFQLQPLADLVDDAASTPATIRRDTRSDPAYWIDRACAIVRFTIPIFEDDLAANSAGSNNNNNNNNNNMNNNNNSNNNNNNNNNNNHNHNNNNGNYHPTLQILTEAWPLLSRVMDKYQSVMRVMERTCRLIRYALRMIRKQAAMMLDPLLKKMVGVYVTNHHSCFLYLGSVLVDELACMPECVPQLLEMLQAFVEPTFNMLSVDGGLKNNPDTVDDFFRLCSRFVVCCPLPLLESALVPPVLRCALLSCTLDHREANKSVMQFFTNLLKWGRVPNERLLACKPLVVQIAILHGEDLAVNLIHSSIFCLHSYMLPDVGEVLYELKTVVQPDKMKNFLRVALDALPKKNSGGYVTATQKQLDDFITTTLSADCSKTVSQALKTFTRLYK